MLNRFRIPSRFALACALLLLSSVASYAQAQSSSVKSAFMDGEQEPTAINVLVGQSRVINFDKPIGRFSVSNPEIAEALFVSRKTVETHLRHIFHKLGVSSRVEVARAIEAAPQAARVRHRRSTRTCAEALDATASRTSTRD